MSALTNKNIFLCGPYEGAHAFIVAMYLFLYCMSVPLCGLLVGWLLPLWKEDQSLSVSETREGIWGNPLHFQQIIFQVDRSQGGARITRVAHRPLPHQPATTTQKHLNILRGLDI